MVACIPHGLVLVHEWTKSCHSLSAWLGAAALGARGGGGLRARRDRGAENEGKGRARGVEGGKSFQTYWLASQPLEVFLQQRADESCASYKSYRIKSHGYCIFYILFCKSVSEQI